MSVVTLPLSTAAPTATDRAIRLAGAIATTHLAIALWPMTRHALAAHDARPLIAHLVALLLALTVLVADRPSMQPLRDWLPLALGPFLYIELRWLIAGVGRPHADALVQRWEGALFPSHPAASWATQLPVRWVSELLHFAYASYYLLIYLPPAILYLRGRRASHANTLLALTIVYAVCFATYLLFPVDGPRFLSGPAAGPEGPVRAFVIRLLDAGSSRGTAFPSSHVAASVVASLCALGSERRTGIVVALLTVGLAAGAVYGGFHYLVDVVAGAVVGLAAWLLATVIWRALCTPGAQSATAAR